MAGWGFNFTFNMTVQSDSNQNVSVMLWRSPTGSEPFTLLSNVTQEFSTNTNVTYVFDPDNNATTPTTNTTPSQTSLYCLRLRDSNGTILGEGQPLNFSVTVSSGNYDN